MNNPAKCAKLVELAQEGSLSHDEIVAILKEEGFSILESIKFFRAELALGGEESKKIVHFSPAWTEFRQGNEALHADIERYAKK